MMLELMDILCEDTGKPCVGRQALIGRLHDSQCGLSLSKNAICDGTCFGPLHARPMWVQATIVVTVGLTCNVAGASSLQTSHQSA